MYDPTFSASSLERHIYKGDFRRYPSLTDPTKRAYIINRAAEIGRSGFTDLRLQTNAVSGKLVYRLTDLPSELVLRKAAENLQTIANTKQSNRLEIVRRLRLLLEEGLPFCVAKTDIRSFYETIDQDHLKELLRLRLFTSPGTRLILRGFIDQCAIGRVTGLPRGLSISAVLSEFYMQDFDECIRTRSYIKLYCRYVDDIIVIVQPNGDFKSFRREIRNQLPKGLRLNARKTKFFNFDSNRSPNPGIEHGFEYLGFSFEVHKIGNSNPYDRTVRIDIARSKINKRKTRVMRSLLQFIKDQDFKDLHDRLKLLTCNYSFRDSKSERVRYAGVYHTYRLISLPSPALTELDQFLRKVLLSNTGKICGPLTQVLSKSQKKELLRLTFAGGYRNRIHFHFGPDRLNHLIKCWKYA